MEKIECIEYDPVLDSNGVDQWRLLTRSELLCIVDYVWETERRNFRFMTVAQVDISPFYEWLE